MGLDLSLFVHAVTVLALSVILVFSLYQRSRAKDAQRAWDANARLNSADRPLQGAEPNGPRT